MENAARTAKLVQHPAALVAVGGHHKAKIPNMIAFARLAGTAAEGNFEENLAPLATPVNGQRIPRWTTALQISAAATGESPLPLNYVIARLSCIMR